MSFGAKADDADALLRSEFAKNTFDAEAWTETRFKDTTQQLMAERHRQLRVDKQKAASALRQAVTQNYSTFISTSSEIGSLEIDMSEVRALLTDMNGTLKSLETFKLSFGQHQQGVALAERTLDFRARNELKKALSGAGSEFEWLLRVPERLDAAIVERQFDAAVADAERAARLLRKYEHLDAQLTASGVRPAVEASTARLREALEQTLRSASADVADVRAAIALMQRLGWTETAREAFLEQRSREIGAAVKRLAFTGDRRQYVGDVARLVFASIVSTCDDFVCSFAERAMLSAFVVWAVREIERFAGVFAQHVFVVGANFELMGDCIAIAKQHCEILEEKGVYTSFLLDRQFHRRLRAAIESAQQALQNSLEQATRNDTWIAKQSFVYDNQESGVDAASTASAQASARGAAAERTTLQLSESARHLYSATQRFLRGTTRVVTLELTPTLARGFGAIIDNYIGEMTRRLRDGRLTAAQSVAAIANAANIVMDLVPRIVDTYQRALGDVPLRPMEEMAEAAEHLFAGLCEVLSAQRAELIVHKKLLWQEHDYTSADAITDSAAPAAKFARLFAYMDELDATLAAAAGEQSKQMVLEAFVVSVANLLTNNTDRFWRKHRTFGAGGINQYLLDMRFVSAACGAYRELIAEKMLNAEQRALQRAPSDAVKPQAWFDERIEPQLQQVNQAARRAATLPFRVREPMAPPDALANEEALREEQFLQRAVSARTPRKSKDKKKKKRRAGATSKLEHGISPRLSSRSGLRKKKSGRK